MERLRNVCEALVQWVIEDKGYISEMKNDIEKLNEKRASLDKHSEVNLRKKLEQVKGASLGMEKKRLATEEACKEAQLQSNKLDILLAKVT
ncbi:hypothetical protein Ciccas_011334 [Cichlidogyrus casuarinus]|uniref:Uncharacterized protein n=1 Tax=Cichlidogyrus casuarinus TaxID=1844966 RepID=A0ABD2PSD1_9PLAT